MDPDEALRQLRARMATLQEIIDRCDEDTGRVLEEDREELEDAANEAVDFWNGLDQWISRGGFLPDAWRSGR